MIRVFSVRILYIRVDDSHGDDEQATNMNNPPRDRSAKFRALGFPTRQKREKDVVSRYFPRTVLRERLMAQLYLYISRRCYALSVLYTLPMHR